MGKKYIIVLSILLLFVWLYLSLGKMEKIILEVSSICTERDCGNPTICCNACVFRGWTAQESSISKVHFLRPNPPSCRVDGCGRCDFVLDAQGYRFNNVFYVVNWHEKYMKYIDTQEKAPILKSN